MAFTFGFYNSLNGDRRYDAVQMSSIFDGIIKDGIFMSIGTSMMVRAASGMMVNIGAGRSWFDHTWSLNSADMPVELDQSEVLQDRIDTIVLDVDSTESVRKNEYLIIKGQPSSVNPVAPSLIHSLTRNQYPLCDVRIDRGTTEITQGNISNRIGTSDTPFITGILDTINIDALIIQWETQWNEWTEKQKSEFLTWSNQQKTDFATFVFVFEQGAKAFQNSSEMEFNAWFQNLKTQLDTNAIGNLQNQINAIIVQEFNRFYGLINKITEVNKDSYGNTVSIVETSSESIATTTFAEEDSKQIITTKLIPLSGSWNYIKTTTITPTESGTTIDESFQKTAKV